MGKVWPEDMTKFKELMDGESKEEKGTTVKAEDGMEVDSG